MSEHRCFYHTPWGSNRKVIVIGIAIVIGNTLVKFTLGDSLPIVDRSNRQAIGSRVETRLHFANRRKRSIIVIYNAKAIVSYVPLPTGCIMLHYRAIPRPQQHHGGEEDDTRAALFLECRHDSEVAGIVSIVGELQSIFSQYSGIVRGTSASVLHRSLSPFFDNVHRRLHEKKNVTNLFGRKTATRDAWS